MSEEKEPTIDEAKLTELRAKHGEVFVTKQGGVLIAFRCATEPEYFRTLGASQKDAGTGPKAIADLASRCVVYPELTAFAEIVRRRPGIALKVGAEILKVANGDEADLAGKA